VLLVFVLLFGLLSGGPGSVPVPGKSAGPAIQTTWSSGDICLSAHVGDWSENLPQHHQDDCSCCFACNSAHGSLTGLPAQTAFIFLTHTVSGRAPPPSSDHLAFFHLRLRADPRAPPAFV